MPKSAQLQQKTTTQPTIQREEDKDGQAIAQPNLAGNRHITPAQVPYLQRAMGNRAVVQLLNNQRAAQVQRSPLPTVQRHHEEDQVQRAPAADVQRHYPHGATASALPPQLEEEPKIDAAGPQK